MRRSPLFYVGSIRRTPRACEPPHPSYQRGFVQARDDFVEHRRPFILTELEARRDRANDRAKADHLRAHPRLAIAHFLDGPRRAPAGLHFGDQPPEREIGQRIVEPRLRPATAANTAGEET